MSRVVTIRSNYSSDTQYLFRLAEAIEHDKGIPGKLRKQSSIKIYELIQLFCEANKIKAKGNNYE